jgi:RsmE family RNA methyltransferase
MNRILVEAHEIEDGMAVLSDVRADHILAVLHGEVGNVLKTGTVDGRIGCGEIVSVERRATGEASVVLRLSHTEEALAPCIDLILAPPRPRVLKRLLPQLATLGVASVTLVGAKKVEKDFWGATLLKEENFRPLFIDGLMQSGVATAVPEVRLVRNLRGWVRTSLDEVYPSRRRIVAHPYEAGGGRRVPLPATDPSRERMLLAVGPEGGWTDDEVALLEEKGFVRLSLGDRILRTDTAVIALLSRFCCQSA